MLEQIVQMLVFPGFFSAALIGFLYEGLTRKLAARMQSRVGPPVWQPFFDWVKLMFKESIVPRNAMPLLFTLCPVAAFAASLSAVFVIPVYGQAMINFQGNMIVLIYLLVISSLAIALAGWASGNPLAFHGSVREIVQLFSYELPFILSLFTIGIFTGFSVAPFMAWQFPLAFLGYMASMQGKLSLPPFHIPDAEQEIVSGPLVEYSGSRLGMFSLARAVSFWVLASLGAVLFLGGSSSLLPGMWPDSLLWFFLKSLAIVFLVSVTKVVFSRLRIEQALRLYWFFLGPLVLIDLFRAATGFMVF